MKRLYVVPTACGVGLGNRLVIAIPDRARRLGCRDIRLDTLPSMAGAIAFYRRHDFGSMPAYYDTPVEETLFFHRPLG